MQIFSFFINPTLVWLLSLCVWLFSLDLSFAEKPKSPKKGELTKMSLTLKSPEHLCRLGFSSQISIESLDLMNAAFQEVIGVSCATAEAPSIDVERAKNELADSLKNFRFFFWLEISGRTRELIIRAYEPSHGLQWGFAKARIEGLSASSMAVVMSDAVRNLMAQFPFAGILEGSTARFWKPIQNRSLELVRRANPERHPLNAFLLRPRWTPISTSHSQVVKGSADSYRIDFSVPAVEAALNEDLWIVLTAH